MPILFCTYDNYNQPLKEVSGNIAIEITGKGKTSLEIKNREWFSVYNKVGHDWSRILFQLKEWGGLNEMTKFEDKPFSN